MTLGTLESARPPIQATKPGLSRGRNGVKRGDLPGSQRTVDFRHRLYTTRAGYSGLECQVVRGERGSVSEQHSKEQRSRQRVPARISRRPLRLAPGMRDLPTVCMTSMWSSPLYSSLS